MSVRQQERELWILGLGDRIDRGALICSYLAEGGYRSRTANIDELEQERPLGIILDISPHSTDGWGILTSIKSRQETRDIPVLPVFLSEKGRVGGVFPVAGFFLQPVNRDHLAEKLAVMGLTEDTEDYDLQAMLVTRKGDEDLAHALTDLGFTLLNAYSAKEGLALATTTHPYLVFTSFMLQDASAFEFQERLRLYPQTHNIPLFVLLKDATKDGERMAMSRSVEHLVRKKELTREEFLAHFRRH
ncbi:MAG TPA: response regulator [Geobacteraceae bacterium]|nr:response regulator [Geobacteraceae bacterium]